MLASRTFTPDDQLKFAALTGDFNPIHMDPLAARRTQAGAPVVHGIHSLLWLLDSLAARNPDLPVIEAMKVRFARMIYVGDQVTATITHRDASELRAEVTVHGIAAVQLRVTFGLVSSVPVFTLPDAVLVPRPAVPLDRPLGEMAGRSGTLAFAGNPEDMERMFPHAAQLLGARRLAALGCSTLLVGMVIPGLHSLYAGLTITVCEDSDTAENIVFRVTSADPRFRMVRLDIYGGGLSGSLEAFARHPPVAQATLETVVSLVARDEFAGSTALIVGGSRGLGELTAKIIAAGGGTVIVTYAVGKVEAEALAADITAWGGRCEAIPYDVRQDADKQLSVIIEAPTHIYYFATPPIFQVKPRLFSQARFEEFNEFYVYGFYRLIEASLRRRPGGVGVFYPSSVSVEKRPVGMTEYTMSKAAGEILCADINAQMPKVRITVSRLPRLLTDQTATLQQPEGADPLAVMLPLIRDVT